MMDIETDNKRNMLEVDDDDDDDNDNDNDNDNDDDDDDAPFILDDETQREHSYCDDARDRGVWDDRGDEPLPFGFFADGCGGGGGGKEGNSKNETTGTICRNKLNNQERLEDGFVTLSNLVLPKCQSVICTTFTHNDETVRFLRDHFGSKTGTTLPSQVLLLGHGDYQGSSFCGIPFSGPPPDDDPSSTTKSNTNTKITPSSLPTSNNDNNSEWFWMACRPFGNDHHLMHAKLLLFRSQEGLRIVVSGNNLTEHQWTEDRDCLWILDIPVSNTVDLTEGSSGTGQEETISPYFVTPDGDNDERYSDNDERYSDNEPPLSRLRYFLIDLMKSSPAFHNIEYRLDKEITTFLYQHVGELLDGLCDNHPINCNNGINSRGHRCMFRFIFSFPRQFRRGGWQQLAGAVRALRHQEEDAIQQQQLKLKQGTESTKASIYQQTKMHQDDDDLFYDTDDGYSDDDDRDGKNANVHIERAIELEESIHMYAMSGSFGDLKPDFLRQMRLAFCGFDLHTGNDNEGQNVKNDRLKKWLVATRSPSIDCWPSIQKTYCLWPSQHIVKRMNPIAILGRGRPMSWKHWKTIPKPAQRRLFFDAVPNPYKTSLVCSTASQIAAGNRGISSNKIIVRMDRGDYKLRTGLLESYYAFTHGKAIIASNMVTRRCTTTKTIYSNKINKIFEKKSSTSSNCDGASPPHYTALYAGSHNFSKKAWGIRRAMPGNVEFGVVLFTTNPDQAERWRSRLPYRLPEPGENSNGYRPGRSADVFKFKRKEVTTASADNSD
jgi:hypothetical protein